MSFPKYGGCCDHFADNSIRINAHIVIICHYVVRVKHADTRKKECYLLVCRQDAQGGDTGGRSMLLVGDMSCAR